MIEAILSSEMSVLTRTTWHNIPEDGILWLSLLFAVCCLLFAVCMKWHFLLPIIIAMEHIDTTNKQTNTVAFSLPSNYTDRVATTCRRS
jgi:hypothetical protein